MDRAERTGLGIAAAGHVALFGALSLGLLTTSKPKPPMNDPMEVQLVDEIGLRSAMPVPAVEPPAPSEAPEVGRPQEAAPTPAPPLPEPTPAPPQPTPKPAPVPKPQPKPAAAKPAPIDEKPRRRPDKPVAEKPRGSLLGPDFLKGISPEKSAGKAATPRAATMNAQAMAGLAAAIRRQVEPCLSWPEGGVDIAQLEIVLNVHLDPSGRITSGPTVVERNGITDVNRPYAAAVTDAASRAVARCASDGLKLPAELYDVGGMGWNNITFGLRPRG